MIAGCELCFDLTESAGFYSQLMGVLAGITVAVIILLLQDHTAQSPGVLAVFSAALIGATVATFLFGTVAGEETQSGRMLLLNLIAVFVGGVTALCIMYGLLLLLHPQEHARGVIHYFFGSAVPAILGIYATVTTINFATFPAGDKSALDWWAKGEAAALGLLAVALVLIPWWLACSKWPEGGRETGQLMAKLAVGSTTVCAVGAGVVTHAKPRFEIHGGVGLAAAILIDLALAAYSIAVYLLPGSAKASS